MSKSKIRSASLSVVGRNKEKDAEKPALDADIQKLLGRKLGETYRALVEEEVPARFLDLLKELKSKEGETEGGHS